jgi:hypothetical protein
MLAYKITTLDGPQGAYGAVAEGINNLGEVVGYYKDPGGVSDPLHDLHTTQEATRRSTRTI